MDPLQPVVDDSLNAFIAEEELRRYRGIQPDENYAYDPNGKPDGFTLARQAGLGYTAYDYTRKSVTHLQRRIVSEMGADKSPSKAAGAARELFDGFYASASKELADRYMYRGSRRPRDPETLEAAQEQLLGMKPIVERACARLPWASGRPGARPSGGAVRGGADGGGLQGTSSAHERLGTAGTDRREALAEGAAAAPPAPGSASPGSRARIRELEGRLAALKDENERCHRLATLFECNVCLSNRPKNLARAFVPCVHSICADCVPGVLGRGTCQTCRGIVTGVQLLVLPEPRDRDDDEPPAAAAAAAPPPTAAAPARKRARTSR